jgi:transcription elongation factor GreA
VFRTEAAGEVVRVDSVVRVRDVDGEEEFTIVGPEEADAARDRVSVDSPLGGALVGRRVGDRVRFRAPGGIMSVTLVALK